MPNTDVQIAIVMIAFIGIVVIAFARSRTSGANSERQLLRDRDGRLIAIGAREAISGQMSGRGAETSAPQQLAAGLYRIDYDFEASTRLALIDPRDGSDETLVIASGAGETSVEIRQAGRYHWRIEPTRADAAWSVVYRQLMVKE